MLPQEYLPHPPLQPFVKTIWCVERVFAPQHAFEILPDSHIEIVFSFGAACTVQGMATPLEPSYLVGLLPHSVPIVADGEVRLIGVRFYPWGFYALFGKWWPHSLTGIHRAMMFDPMAHTLAPLAYPAQAVDHLQRWLIRQSLHLTIKEPEFVRVAQTILEEKGQLEMSDLVVALPLSARTLRRRFQSILGLAPKSLARLARFEQVRDALWQTPTRDLAEMALAAGYADQAHMQREFRQFTPWTPRQFARQMQQMKARMEADQNIQSFEE